MCVYDEGSDDIYSEFFAASYVKKGIYESVISINTKIKSEILREYYAAMNDKMGPNRVYHESYNTTKVRIY